MGTAPSEPKGFSDENEDELKGLANALVAPKAAEVASAASALLVRVLTGSSIAAGVAEKAVTAAFGAWFADTPDARLVKEARVFTKAQQDRAALQRFAAAVEPVVVKATREVQRVLGALQQGQGELLASQNEGFDTLAGAMWEALDGLNRIERNQVKLREAVTELHALIERRQATAVDGARSQGQPTRYEYLANALGRAVEQLVHAADLHQPVDGLPSGFTRLDAITGGMHPGELILIAGCSGMGKTAFALSMALNVCRLRKAAVAFFCVATPTEQLSQRVLSSEARVFYAHRQLSGDDWARMTAAFGTLSDLPILLVDAPNLTLANARETILRLKAERDDLAFVVFDHLQLMRADEVGSHTHEMRALSRALKGMAREHNLSVVALSQLNEPPRGHQNGVARPCLIDLRESGSIDQDADMVLFVHRDEVSNPQTPDRGIVEVIVGKQRAGRTGTAKCLFLAEYARVEDLYDGFDEEIDQQQN